MRTLHFVVATLLAGPAAAQGAGHANHVVGVNNNSGTSSPLFEIDRQAGVCTAISGLQMSGVSSVQLDPINKEIWVGGAGGVGGVNNGQLRRVQLDGAFGVASEVTHAVVAVGAPPAPRPITGIAFDDDGNPVVTTRDSVVRVSRFGPSPATTLLHQFATSSATSTAASAICRDDGGNLYVGVSGSGDIWRLQKNPDCSYQPAQRLGSVVGPTASNSATITGLDFCPSDGQLYWSTLGVGTGGRSFGTFALPSGPAVAAGPGYQVISTNGLAYDVRADDFMVVDDTPSSLAWTVSKQFSTGGVCLIPQGPGDEINAIATGDLANAATRVLPSCQPVAGARFVLEAATTCPPGSVGGVFVGAPQLSLPFLTVAVGTVDKTGRLSARVPNVPWPGGLPAGVLTFVSGCFDPGSSSTTVGSVLPWPAN
ncbi:MAG: hypothetical protein AAF628_29095 [Planctomycetota bacterium]